GIGGGWGGILNAQFFNIKVPDNVIKNYSGDKNSCKKTGQKADNRGYRKSLYRAGPEHDQKNSGDYTGDMCINDCYKCPIVTRFQRQPDSLSRPQLFPYSFKDQDVRVNRDAHGEQ